jgi:hypothetical protein
MCACRKCGVYLIARPESKGFEPYGLLAAIRRGTNLLDSPATVVQNIDVVDHPVQQKNSAWTVDYEIEGLPILRLVFFG